MNTMNPSTPAAQASSGAWEASPPGVVHRILYVEQNRDGTIGGSYRSLLLLLQGLDHQIYLPIVAFYRGHELLDDFRRAGCRTLVLWYPTPIDLTTPLRGIGAPGRLLLPLFRLLQKVLNFWWVSIPLFVRNVALLLRERIDILHLNNGVGVGAEFLVAAKLLGLKCVIHQRGIGPLPKRGLQLARRVDHIICVSDAARQNLIEHGLDRERCSAVHNGISLADVEGQIRRDRMAVKSALGLAPETLVIGLAGMIRRWKGQMVLVRAVERLQPSQTSVKVLIMGGVSDRYPRDRAYLDEVCAFIREHDLEDRIMILDHQPNAMEFLQVFDIMVHAAIDPEPFSRAVIEGMALGLPIVASSTGGTPEAIQDGVSGFLVPPDDPDALAERIDLLLRRPDLREAFGRAARETVQRKFLIEQHVSRTQDIYDCIIRRASA
jgi:glycosyltransferase involved in cell wall biosynthesis